MLLLPRKRPPECSFLRRRAIVGGIVSTGGVPLAHHCP